MDFWDNHGVLFLLFAMVFPRLTLLFGASLSFGPLAWVGFLVGWVLVPSFVVAIYASALYLDTNPLLCVAAWAFAIGKFLWFTTGDSSGGSGITTVMRTGGH